VAYLEIQYVSLVPWPVVTIKLNVFKGQKSQLTILFDKQLVCALNLDFGNETDAKLL